MKWFKSLFAKPSIEERIVGTLGEDALGVSEFGDRWLLVNSNNLEAVAEEMGMKHLSWCNWAEARFASARNIGTAIYPTEINWAVVRGYGVPSVDYPIGEKYASELVLELSRQFGKAQLYTCFNGVDAYGWFLAENGVTIRRYFEVENKVKINEGIPVPEEQVMLPFSPPRRGVIPESRMKEEYTYQGDILVDIAKQYGVNPVGKFARPSGQNLCLRGYLPHP